MPHEQFREQRLSREHPLFNTYSIPHTATCHTHKKRAHTKPVIPQNPSMKLQRKSGSSAAALLFLDFRIHSRVRGHYHYHHRHRDHDGSHRIMSGLASDFSASGRADVFDSCLIACYEDIVSRYGKEFADFLRMDGFVFETCPSDQVNSTYLQETTADARRKQRALNRILGATNQLNKLWTTRGLDGKLQIPFKVKSTSAFTQETLNTIDAALQDIEDATGIIKFIDQTVEQEYIYFSYEVTSCLKHYHSHRKTCPKCRHFLLLFSLTVFICSILVILR